MSKSSASEHDWEAVDDETLAELEAEQARYVAELQKLRRGDTAASTRTADQSPVDLAAENERLRAELEAAASLSASATKRDAEHVKAQLARLSTENAKLTAALANGVGLSGITGVRPSTSVLAASRSRMLAMVTGNIDINSTTCFVHVTPHHVVAHVCRIRELLPLLSGHQTCTQCCKS